MYYTKCIIGGAEQGGMKDNQICRCHNLLVVSHLALSANSVQARKSGFPLHSKK